MQKAMPAIEICLMLMAFAATPPGKPPAKKWVEAPVPPKVVTPTPLVAPPVVEIREDQMDAIAMKVVALLLKEPNVAMKAPVQPGLSQGEIDAITASVTDSLLQERLALVEQPFTLPITWSEEFTGLTQLPERVQKRSFRLHVPPAHCKTAACREAVENLSEGDEDIDVAVVEAEVPGAKTYPCLVEIATNHAYYGDEIRNLGVLRQRLGIDQPRVGFSFLNIGSIKREDLYGLLAKLNDTDACPSLGNKEIPLPEMNGVYVTIPAKFGASWKSTGGKRSFTFTRPPAVKWGLLSTTVSGFTWDGGDKIMVNTGWSAVQGTITVE